MVLDQASFDEHHREVVEALTAIGDPARGRAVQEDRGSQLAHLGVTFPALRRRVRQGFSFYRLPQEEVLAVWDALWKTSPYGDVLFAAIEYYAPLVRKGAGAGIWPLVGTWSARVDNWCHSDGLSGLYAHILAQRFADVYPQLVAWNRSAEEWLRRISLVSLIHYSGKNAVFLPPRDVLPLVSNCLDDRREHVQMAAGWVLREMGRVYVGEITAYLETHGVRLSAPAFARAISRFDPDVRLRLRGLRKRG